MNGPKGVLVVDLNDGLHAVIELEREAPVNYEACVEATRFDLDALGVTSGLLFRGGNRKRAYGMRIAQCISHHVGFRVEHDVVIEVLRDRLYQSIVLPVQRKTCGIFYDSENDPQSKYLFSSFFGRN